MDYQPRHAAFSTEPQPKGGPLDADASGHAPWDCPRMDSAAVAHGKRHICLDYPAEASIFDAPDAATTHARQTAQALIHEYQTFANTPGHWTGGQSAAWIGQACAVLTELAK